MWHIFRRYSPSAQTLFFLSFVLAEVAVTVFFPLEQEEDEVLRHHSETSLKLLSIKIWQVVGCGGLL
jgi:hypothetical protein